jgi:hypothetical protein
MGGLFILIGVPALLLGLAILFRPDIVRRLTGMAKGNAATYALRIAGMMIAAFGLILSGFSIAYRLSVPADLSYSPGAN